MAGAAEAVAQHLRQDAERVDRGEDADDVSPIDYDRGSNVALRHGVGDRIERRLGRDLIGSAVIASPT